MPLYIFKYRLNGSGNWSFTYIKANNRGEAQTKVIKALKNDFELKFVKEITHA